MTTARGVLKRHCAIGKTPLLAPRLCNRPLGSLSYALNAGAAMLALAAMATAFQGRLARALNSR